MMEISIEKCNDPTILRYLYYNDNKLDGIVRWYSLKKLKKRGNEIKKERRNEALFFSSKIVSSIIRFISLYTRA